MCETNFGKKKKKRRSAETKELNNNFCNTIERRRGEKKTMTKAKLMFLLKAERQNLNLIMSHWRLQ